MRDHLEAQLIRDEGLRLKPYTDTVGKLTIGVGRNLTDRGLSASEAMLLLKNDVDIVERECRARFDWWDHLDEVRQGVLLNMAFNLGMTRLLRFPNTLEMIRQGAYEEAAVAMLQSKWSEQVGDRALRLAEQMRTGKWV